VILTQPGTTSSPHAFCDCWSQYQDSMRPSARRNREALFMVEQREVLLRKGPAAARSFRAQCLARERELEAKLQERLTEALEASRQRVVVYLNAT
jgi:hypothetical protein